MIPFFANSSNEFWEEKNWWFSSPTQHTRHVIAMDESNLGKTDREIRTCSQPTDVTRDFPIAMTSKSLRIDII